MPRERSTKKRSEEHPSGDDRYLAIDRTMKLFAYESDALLEVLNTAQEAFGYLSEELLIYVSGHLKVPLSRVFGVATFYHMFTFSPLGEHNCIICAGTACHVKGAPKVVDTMERALKIPPGETTEDMEFTFETVNCLGACALGPLVVADGEYHGKMDQKKTERLLTKLKEQSSETPEESDEDQT